MSEPTEERHHVPGALLPETKVEVRTAFDRSWAGGFVVAQVLDDGYRLKRRSDGELLPTVFPFDDVRRERRNAMWWM